MQIKEFKSLTTIELKSWRRIFTEASMEEVGSLLSSKSFAVVNGIGFNVYEVREFYEYNPNDIEVFIYQITDKIKQERFEKIYREREEKNLKTNWTKHLVDIYVSRYWEDY